MDSRANQADRVEQSYQSLVGDVCNIFKEVVGADADYNKESTSILFWARRGWQVRDFRLFIESEWSREDRRNWYISNGRLKLSHILMINDSSVPIIEDKMDSIRQIEKVRAKLVNANKDTQKTISTDIIVRAITCYCGRKINAKIFSKLYEGQKFKWIEEIHQDYEQHYKYAGTEKLICMGQ